MSSCITLGKFEAGWSDSSFLRENPGELILIYLFSHLITFLYFCALRQRCLLSFFCITVWWEDQNVQKNREKKTKTSSLSLRRWLVGIQETVKAQRSVSKMSWWVKTTLLSSFPAPAFLEPHTHITHEAQGSSWQQRVPCQAQLVLNLRWNRNVGNFDLLSVSLTRDTNST